MTAPSTHREAELDRLCELASIGAGWAAAALTQLLGRTVTSEVPALRELEHPSEKGPWRTALVFETEGPLAGVIALLLTRASVAQATGMLLGGAAEVSETMADSALRELGNIVASQTVSAIANTIGGRVMLSIPTLIHDDAERALEAVVALRRNERSAPCIECALSDPSQEVRALLVFAPDALVA